MHKYTKLLLACAITGALTAVVASSAFARQFVTSSQAFRVTWRELILGGGIEDICEVTLEGSFHSRTLVKSPGSLIGYVTAVNVTNCSLPTTTRLNLPWHVQYSSFVGVLPDIRSIRIDLMDASFLVDAGIVRCLFRSNGIRPASGELILNASRVVTSLRSDETARIPLFTRLGGIVACPADGTLTGTSSSVTSSTGAAITVTLI